MNETPSPGRKARDLIAAGETIPAERFFRKENI